jgi:hypothetical protein
MISPTVPQPSRWAIPTIGTIGTTRPGPSIVEGLLKEAEPANAATSDPAKTRNLLRLDRELLELYACLGRAITAYTNRNAQLGVK